MLVSGNSERQTDTEFIPGLMATDFRASSRNVLNMDKDSKDLPMAISTRAFMPTENLQDLDSIIG